MRDLNEFVTTRLYFLAVLTVVRVTQTESDNVELASVVQSEN